MRAVLLAGGRYAWRADPSRPAGELHISSRPGRIERLRVTVLP